MREITKNDFTISPNKSGAVEVIFKSPTGTTWHWTTYGNSMTDELKKENPNIYTLKYLARMCIYNGIFDLNEKENDSRMKIRCLMWLCGAGDELVDELANNSEISKTANNFRIVFREALKRGLPELMDLKAEELKNAILENCNR